MHQTRVRQAFFYFTHCAHSQQDVLFLHGQKLYHGTILYTFCNYLFICCVSRVRVMHKKVRKSKVYNYEIYQLLSDCGCRYFFSGCL